MKNDSSPVAWSLGWWGMWGKYVGSDEWHGCAVRRMNGMVVPPLGPGDLRVNSTRMGRGLARKHPKIKNCGSVESSTSFFSNAVLSLLRNKYLLGCCVRPSLFDPHVMVLRSSLVDETELKEEI